MDIHENYTKEGIRYAVFCYPYSQDTLIGTDVDQQSPAVHFVTIEEEQEPPGHLTSASNV